jgi:hypothetical protein
MTDNSGVPPSQSRLRSWTPHLWVFIMPVAAVVITYTLYFSLMAILRLPDWLAGLFSAR